MDIEGQQARDPDEAPNAWEILAEHVQNSIIGCCNKCGRPWDDRAQSCDAPEVLWAFQVLRSHNPRPDYRVGGANAKRIAYDYIS